MAWMARLPLLASPDGATRFRATSNADYDPVLAKPRHARTREVALPADSRSLTGAAAKLVSVESVPATRSRRDPQGVFRRVLLGGLIVVGIIVGLVAMHTLNLHGTPAAQASATVSLSAPGTAGTHHGVAVGQHVSADTANDFEGACTDCGAGDHLAMAMACVLALLLVLLVLAPPRLLRGWRLMPPRADPRVRLSDGVLFRAPSLHVLCISRT